jgi:hypothetical protein
MKEADLKLIFNRLIAMSILCLVLVTILLVNVLSLNKQIKTLDSLPGSVNDIKKNTSQLIKPTDSMTCKGQYVGMFIELNCSYDSPAPVSPAWLTPSSLPKAN